VITKCLASPTNKFARSLCCYYWLQEIITYDVPVVSDFTISSRLRENLSFGSTSWKMYIISRFSQPILFLYLRKDGTNLHNKIITATIVTELQSRIIKARTLHLIHSISQAVVRENHLPPTQKELWLVRTIFWRSAQRNVPYNVTFKYNFVNF